MSRPTSILSVSVLAVLLSPASLAAQSTAPPNIAPPQGEQRQPAATTDEVKMTGCVAAGNAAGAGTEANTGSKVRPENGAGREDGLRGVCAAAGHSRDQAGVICRTESRSDRAARGHRRSALEAAIERRRVPEPAGWIHRDGDNPAAKRSNVDGQRGEGDCVFVPVVRASRRPAAQSSISVVIRRRCVSSLAALTTYQIAVRR